MTPEQRRAEAQNRERETRHEHSLYVERGIQALEELLRLEWESKK